MTTLYSVNYNKAYEIANAVVGAGEFHGKVHVMYDTYVYSAALTLADRIYLTKLPAGARVLEAVLRSTTTSGAGKFNLGHLANEEKDGTTISEDDNAFIDALDPTAGTATSVMSATANLAGLGIVFADAAQLFIEVDTAGTTATDGTLTAIITYVVD